ncbi:lectin [Streptomyces sp. NPDC046978]|uniref:GH92 family glycosyl hydrolase n=1 Tax=Streptomyces sp. NPDC046978 TaxID=3154704 RepID=UPI0033CB20B5
MANPRSLRPPRFRSRFRRRLAAVSVLAMAALPLQALGAVSAFAAPAFVGDPASLVNPLIGTSGEVDTFPGPDMPFGMMQWGPDTTPHRALGGGYEYNDSKISGFSLTHMSGPGCSAGGDVPLLPLTGSLSGDLGGTSVGFSHDNEHAALGSYGVKDDNGVSTELTTTTRAGLGRFTFPGSDDSHLLLKLSGGATQIDGTRAQVVNDHEVIGAVQSGHFCGAANTYTIHFDIKFDHPFTGSGTWAGSTVNPDAKALRLGRPKQTLSKGSPDSLAERHFTVPAAPAPSVHGGAGTQGGTQSGPPVTGANGMYLTFDTTSARTVTAAVGISYTSDANARANLTKEVKGWDFDTTRAANHAAWNAVFDRVRIAGGTRDQQTQFYTALYHALLHPNVFSDDNGQYMGMDDQIHTVAKGQQAQYANYSGWDTYRSQTQLMAMVEPKVTGDVVTSMLNGYDQTGLLPKWAQNNGESYVMVGDPADGIIAGARAFGAQNFDVSHALDAMVHEATRPNNDRPGESLRDTKGYLPIDGADWGCCNFYGPVSTQLEYDSADYAIAALAKSLGRNDVYTTFASRAQDWQNVFNPQSGYLQAKKADGEWATGFAPGTSNGFVEGTSAQYTPMVPFNLKALIAARGGAQAWSSYLDSLLSDIADPSATDANLSNEPSLEIPWEYDYVGQPWKTQQAVREAQQKLYFNAPVGSFGNDDLGAMSSWYVWSELGMYPQTPGTDVLALGSPVFTRAQVTLPSGRTLNINAPQAASDAPYVQSLAVNGKAWNKAWTTFDALKNGGTLDYTLGTHADTGWAAADGSAPPSDSTGQRDVLASAGPSGVGLVLSPDGSGTGTLDVSNIGSRAQTVHWTAQAPSGVSLPASSGSFDVGANGTAQQQIKVTAGGTEGVYPVLFSLTDGAGTSLGSVALRVVVARPGELWPYYTTQGVYPDGTRFTGGFDGGGWAYSKDALAAAGVNGGAQSTADGITYTWPAFGSGKDDEIELAGQRIPLAGPSGASWLGLLGAATNAPSTGSSSQVTVTYEDGTTSTGTAVFSDWTLNAGSSKPVSQDTTVVSMPYRVTGSGGQDSVTTYVFATRIPVDPAKQVASVELAAADDGTNHVFAVGFGG